MTIAVTTPTLSPQDAHWAQRLAAQLAFEHNHHAALIRAGGAGVRGQVALCLVRIRALQADLEMLEGMR